MNVSYLGLTDNECVQEKGERMTTDGTLQRMNPVLPKSKRNVAIDIMRCIATVAIFNHLCGPLYGHLSFLATGGALGITLFFFISGYALSSSHMGGGGGGLIGLTFGLGVWPTAFVVVAVGSLLFKGEGDITCAFAGGGWFVKNILIAYVVLYVVRRLRISFLLAFLISCTIVVVWYFIAFDYRLKYAIFGNDTIRTLVLYPFMFLGAALRNMEDRVQLRAYAFGGLALGCYLLFNGLVFMFSKGILAVSYQLVLVPIQLVFVFALYFAMKPWQVSKCLYGMMLFVGGLCLEMYLSYGFIRTTMFNWAFPLNIPINFVLALAFAYFIRCLARMFQQTFQKEDYDWKAVLAPY